MEKSIRKYTHTHTHTHTPLCCIPETNTLQINCTSIFKKWGNGYLLHAVVRINEIEYINQITKYTIKFFVSFFLVTLIKLEFK